MIHLAVHLPSVTITCMVVPNWTTQLELTQLFFVGINWPVVCQGGGGRGQPMRGRESKVGCECGRKGVRE